MNVTRKLLVANSESLVAETLYKLICHRDFCVSDAELETIRLKQESELIDGWIFAYKAYRMSRDERIEYIRHNISHTNPRIREQICDIIGDESIVELKNLLESLFDDPKSFVAEAAKYNSNSMF